MTDQESEWQGGNRPCVHHAVTRYKGAEHGTRRQYQRGCRCLPCTAANAAYWRLWWRDRVRGKQRLGALISPTEARKRIKQLKVDGLSGRELNRRLGLQSHSLVLHPDGITVRKHLRILLEYRRLSAEGPDAPLDQPYV